MSNQRRHQYAVVGAPALNRTQLASTHSRVPFHGDRAAFDRTIAARREADAKQDTLADFHAINARITAVNESESRVESMRRLRRIQQQNAELAMAYTIEQQMAEKEQRRMLAEQDRQLADAMSRMKNEEIAREQEHRRICDESEELSELRARLKAAQLNKARATQLSEKQLIHDIKKEQEAKRDQEMEADRLAALALEQAELERRQLSNMQSRSVLQGQMAEKERAKQRAYEQFLKEKAVIDSIVASIEADDQAKLQAQLEKQRELQQNIRTYLEERATWRAEEKKRAEYELKKIQEYQQLQEQRHAELMAARQQKVDRQDKVLERLTAEIEARRREEEEMQRLLYELYQEEAESRALEEIKAREEKINFMRREMIQANEQQKAFKAARRAALQAEEEEFRSKMLEKFERDAAMEKANVERRKKEMEEYRNEVEHILQERRRQYEQQVEQELAERERQQKEREYKLAIVEAERQRLLDEYAKDLKEYLPKGVFRTPQDYEKVFEKKPQMPERNLGLGQKRIQPAPQQQQQPSSATPYATMPSSASSREMAQKNAQAQRRSNIPF